MDYYLADGTTQRGPVAFEQLAGAGLTRTTLVWREGMGQWQPADTLPELQHLFSPPAFPVPPAAPVGYAMPLQWGGIPPDVSGKKLAAGLCGILLGVFGLGGFGIHKFVLGLTSGAVTMLCITLGGLVLGPFTCGATWFVLPILSIIAIIEGIIYLAKPDAEFYAIYLVQKRQWF